ncbi:hypothetical protein DPMN_027031 [Dreissena polymorpha]|uniref:Uncharacterized protein n=1 Tax=Dreissena polymorpha TaxID=45954 RepID=A0A9D4LUG9_DREPO|nr:hypothetical protein DPMN_027031 [Dreissena polymorpha]
MGMVCQTEQIKDNMLDRFVTQRKPESHMSHREPASRTSKDEPPTTTNYGGKVKPATYDGVGAMADYKAHFEACGNLNGWDSDQKAMYLSVSLRGQAQGVYGNLASYATYEDLVRTLEERLAPPNQTELYRVQLKERQQRATETIAQPGHSHTDQPGLSKSAPRRKGDARNGTVCRRTSKIRNAHEN